MPQKEKKTWGRTFCIRPRVSFMTFETQMGTDTKGPSLCFLQDGRFVFLPEDVGHQGVGICVSKEFPGFLEVCHFWYPCEFTEKTIPFGPGQVYVPMFSARPEQLVEMVQRVYMEYRKQGYMYYCTFPFNPDVVVTLEDNFLDKMSQSIRRIRTTLKNETSQIQRNGEGLITFM